MVFVEWLQLIRIHASAPARSKAAVSGQLVSKRDFQAEEVEVVQKQLPAPITSLSGKENADIFQQFEGIAR